MTTVLFGGKNVRGVEDDKTLVPGWLWNPTCYETAAESLSLVRGKLPVNFKMIDPALEELSPWIPQMHLVLLAKMRGESSAWVMPFAFIFF